MQMFAFGVVTLRGLHQDERNSYCNKKSLYHILKGYARLLIFEWMIINITSLFISLTFLGLPFQGPVTYSYNVTFVLCLVTAAVHYVLFVRWFVRHRRSFVYWRLRDCYFIVSPLVVVVAGVLFIVLVVYLGLEVSVVEQHSSISFILLALAALFLILLTVPFILYVLVRLLRYSAKEHNSYRKRTAMEALLASIAFEKGMPLDRMESITLVGRNLTGISGLESATALKRLYLTYNNLTNLSGIENAPTLEELHIAGNKVATFQGLTALRACPRLKALSLEGNPLTVSEDYSHAKVAALLPQVSLVNYVPITRSMARAAQGPWLRTVLRDYNKTLLRETSPWTSVVLGYTSDLPRRLREGPRLAMDSPVLAELYGTALNERMQSRVCATYPERDHLVASRSALSQRLKACFSCGRRDRRGSVTMAHHYMTHAPTNASASPEREAPQHPATPHGMVFSYGENTWRGDSSSSTGNVRTNHRHMPYLLNNGEEEMEEMEEVVVIVRELGGIEGGTTTSRYTYTTIPTSNEGVTTGRTVAELLDVEINLPE